MRFLPKYPCPSPLSTPQLRVWQILLRCFILKGLQEPWPQNSSRKLFSKLKTLARKSANGASYSSAPPREHLLQFYMFCFSILKTFFKKKNSFVIVKKYQLCNLDAGSPGAPRGRGRSLGRAPSSPICTVFAATRISAASRPQFPPPRACPEGMPPSLTSGFTIAAHTEHSAQVRLIYATPNVYTSGNT